MECDHNRVSFFLYIYLPNAGVTDLLLTRVIMSKSTLLSKHFFSLRSLILGALTTGMELLGGLQYLLTTCQPISGSYVGRQKECLVSDLLG